MGRGSVSGKRGLLVGRGGVGLLVGRWGVGLLVRRGGVGLSLVCNTGQNRSTDTFLEIKL